MSKRLTLPHGDALRERRRRALDLVSESADEFSSASRAPSLPVAWRPPRNLGAPSTRINRSPLAIARPFSPAEILNGSPDGGPVLAGAAISGGDLVVALITMQDQGPVLARAVARFTLKDRDQISLLRFREELRDFLQVTGTKNIIQTVGALRGPYQSTGLTYKAEAALQLSTEVRVRTVPTLRIRSWLKEEEAMLSQIDLTGLPQSKTLRVRFRDAVGAAIWALKMAKFSATKSY